MRNHTNKAPTAIRNIIANSMHIIDWYSTGFFKSPIYHLCETTLFGQTPIQFSASIRMPNGATMPPPHFNPKAYIADLIWDMLALDGIDWIVRKIIADDDSIKWHTQSIGEGAYIHTAEFNYSEELLTLVQAEVFSQNPDIQASRHELTGQLIAKATHYHKTIKEIMKWRNKESLQIRPTLLR